MLNRLFANPRLLVVLLLPLFAAVLLAGWLLSASGCEGPASCLAASGEQAPTMADDAARLRVLQNSDEKGRIPTNAAVEAAEQAEVVEEEPLPGGADAASSGEVAATIDRGSWTWRGPGNVGGRVRSIAIHPTEPQTMWAGSAGGGIWKTTDGGARWEPLNDFLASLAVTTVAVDPKNPDVLYAGTGEGFFSDNAERLKGAGVFKSSDGGANWDQLESTQGENFHFVNRLAVSPNDSQVLLAATRSGIRRSEDGGANWTQTKDDKGALQVLFDPKDGNRAIAGGFKAKAYYSEDGGKNWKAAGGLPNDGGRVELAYAPSNPQIVYASVDKNKGQVFKSTDGGRSYSRADHNQAYEYLGSQGYYDNAIWVDPTNPATLVVGGFELWRSTNWGETFQKISDWQKGNQVPPTSAHADQHAIVSPPNYDGATNKTVYFGNDGGIYKVEDVYAVTPDSGWQVLNNNLGVTQFYGAAGNASGGVIVGGTQDNGSVTYTGDPQGWSTLQGGDGGFSAADPTDPNYFYNEYVYLTIYRSKDGGKTAEDIYEGITDAGEKDLAEALFIAPFILDPNNPSTMLAGGQSLWRTKDVKADEPAWASIKPPVGGGLISAIAVAPGNSNIVWVGYDNGRVYKTENGEADRPTWKRMDQGNPRLPDRVVTRLTVDPKNSDIVYATFGGYSKDNVYRTTNGGKKWKDITGSSGTATGLPDAPARSLVVHPDNSNWLYLGTEVGVFASEDGGQTWSRPSDGPQDVGPANVSVDELSWMGTMLVAATYGRGLYAAETVSTPASTLQENNQDDTR